MMSSTQTFSKESQVFQNRLEHLHLEVKSSMYFSRAWNLFKEHAGLFVPVTVLYGVICFGIAMIPFVGQIIVGVLYPLLVAGYFVVALKLIRGEKAEMSDFFKALKLWYPLTMNGLLGGIMTMIGFACLFIPGLYLYFAYLFSVQMIVDEEVSGWQSLEASRKIITKIFFPFTWFCLFSYLILFSGFIALGVGILATFPLCYIMHAYAYEDIKKQIQAQI